MDSMEKGELDFAVRSALSRANEAIKRAGGDPLTEEYFSRVDGVLCVEGLPWREWVEFIHEEIPRSEYVARIWGFSVEVDWDKGGVQGEEYVGDWTVTAKNGDVFELDRDSFHFESRMGHREVAEAALRSVFQQS